MTKTLKTPNTNTPNTPNTFKTLLLRLDGPMQAWSIAAFADRPTLPFPTKSGIVGLIANAMGRTRHDDIADLAALEIAVRADDPGQPANDFQVAGVDGWRSANGKLHTDSSKPRNKGYLEDAVFTAALTGPASLITEAAEATRRPARPLFLGRRSCPPAAPVLVGLSDLPALEALRTAPYQGHRPNPPQRYLVAIDAPFGERWDDHPLSFAPDRREHGPRSVAFVEVTHEEPQPLSNNI